MILGHLDLDAFFAAVEELENPDAPLQGADRRRRPARTRRRRDRELRGAEVRDPLGDVMRGGAAALPARRLRPAAPQRLPGVLAGGLELGARGRADGRAHRAGRGLPRPRRGGRHLRRGTGAGRGGADVGAWSDEPERGHGRRHVEGRRQDRQRPAQARRPDRRPGRPRGVVPRALRRAAPARRRPALGGSAARGRPRDDRRPRRAHGRRPQAPPPGEGRRPPSRSRARHRPARARDELGARLDQHRGDVRAGHRRPRAAQGRAAPDVRPPRRAPAALGRDRANRDDEGALPGLLDPQPLDEHPGRNRRSASGSASSPARLLDRALDDRPGALRLVGVGSQASSRTDSSRSSKREAPPPSPACGDHATRCARGNRRHRG